MIQSAQGKRPKLSVGVAAMIFIIGGLALFLYQLRRAEMGWSNHLPRVAREFFAAREYRAAKNSEYEDRRLFGYKKVLNLDGDHYPEAWEHICNINIKYQLWDAAKITCKRVADLEGPTATNQITLGEVYEKSGAYTLAGEAYVSAAQLDPRNAVPQEGSLWMFLATRNYRQAVSAASNLVASGSAGSPPVDQMKAHTVLGFAYSQLGNGEQARAAYAIGLPDLRNPLCSMEQDPHFRRALVCSGVSRKNGRSMSSCIGVGCQ
jgi:tetratricopeptide (TPR) repeat protein